jgi:choline dehydrogenase
MQFDYIIVGDGSAGCVVASRLVSEQSARVLAVGGCEGSS